MRARGYARSSRSGSRSSEVADGWSLRASSSNQVELIETGDLEGLLEQYDEDAVLVRFDRVIAGRDGLREFFAGYLAAQPRVRSVDAYAETGDVVSYQATLETAAGEVRGYGVFVLRDGKIWRQAAGVVG